MAGRSLISSLPSGDVIRSPKTFWGQKQGYVSQILLIPLYVVRGNVMYRQPPKKLAYPASKEKFLLLTKMVGSTCPPIPLEDPE